MTLPVLAPTSPSATSCQRSRSFGSRPIFDPERGERLWMLVTQLVEQVHRLGVPLREPVGEGVVVDVEELVRPHDLAELIPLAADRRFDAVDPEALVSNSTSAPTWRRNTVSPVASIPTIP